MGGEAQVTVRGEDRLKLLGIRGKKGVGKNFVAEVLERLLFSHGLKVELMAFADPLKEMLVEPFGIDRAMLFGNVDDKESPTEYQWERIPEAIRSKEFSGRTGAMSVRDMLKFVGTDLMRQLFDQQIWVKAMCRKIDLSHADVVLITDVRFPNELSMVRDYGGRVIMVKGVQRAKTVLKADIHSTENALDGFLEDDYVIENEKNDNSFSLREKLKEVSAWLSTTSTARST
jgi:hypothetical protein